MFNLLRYNYLVGSLFIKFINVICSGIENKDEKIKEIKLKWLDIILFIIVIYYGYCKLKIYLCVKEVNVLCIVICIM